MKNQGWILKMGIVSTSLLLLAGCGLVSNTSDLESTAWVLADLAGTPPLEGTTISLEFMEASQLGGSSGCNSYGGGYEIDRDNLVIKELASTLMACLDPEGVMDQEQRFLEVLSAAETFNISGNRLKITSVDGEVLEFTQSTP